MTPFKEKDTKVPSELQVLVYLDEGSQIQLGSCDHKLCDTCMHFAWLDAMEWRKMEWAPLKYFKLQDILVSHIQSEGLYYGFKCI